MIVQYIWEYLVCTVLRRVQYIGHNQWSGEPGEHVVLMMFVNYVWYLYQYINIRYTLGMYIYSVCAFKYIYIIKYTCACTQWLRMHIYIYSMFCFTYIYIHRNLSGCFWKSTFSESPRTWFIKPADTTVALRRPDRSTTTTMQMNCPGIHPGLSVGRVWKYVC